MASIKLVTFDLDNTLWNVDKVIVRAETKMRNWMKEYAPESVAFYSSDHLAEIRHSILTVSYTHLTLPTKRIV